MRLLSLVALLLLMAGRSALSQEVGSPAAGLALAKEICADCHAVEAGEGVSPNIDAPPFRAIAKKPEMSELALTVFFQSPHPSMPNLIVIGNDARDLVAYILSLKP